MADNRRRNVAAAAPPQPFPAHVPLRLNRRRTGNIRLPDPEEITLDLKKKYQQVHISNYMITLNTNQPVRRGTGQYNRLSGAVHTLIDALAGNDTDTEGYMPNIIDIVGPNMRGEKTYESCIYGAKSEHSVEIGGKQHRLHAHWVINVIHTGFISITPTTVMAAIMSYCQNAGVNNPIAYVHVTRQGRSQAEYTGKVQLYEKMVKDGFINPDAEEPLDEYLKYKKPRTKNSDRRPITKTEQELFNSQLDKIDSDLSNLRI
jgi:hypothetical protein